MDSTTTAKSIWNKSRPQKQVVTPFSNWPSLHDPIPPPKDEKPTDFNLLSQDKQRHHSYRRKSHYKPKKKNQIDILKQWIVYQVYILFKQ
jgi:hypothetical protein